jgi:hypothetical protein
MRKGIITLVFDLYDGTCDDELRDCLVHLIDHARDSISCLDIGEIVEDLCTYSEEEE